MPYFEIAYSAEPTSKALTFQKVLAANRNEAAAIAERAFEMVKQELGACCFRILDTQGMVVARGPSPRR